MTNAMTATKNTEVSMGNYDQCVEAFNDADRMAGVSFKSMIVALNTAREFYKETEGKERGFIKKFQSDSGVSQSYLYKLNRISQESYLQVTANNLGFDMCYALLEANDDLKEEIVNRIEGGETIEVADVKKQVAQAKAALSPEALEELKEDTRKEDRRIAEQKKREREEAMREKAEEYSLDKDYEEMLDRNGRNDDPELLTPETITDAEYEEVETTGRSENEQDTYDQITSMFQHCMPWAPSKELAIDIVSYIADQYSLNLSEIIQK